MYLENHANKIVEMMYKYKDLYSKVESPPKFASKKMRAAEIREEKEAKRRERETLRQKRAAEKAEVKAQKEAERTARRAMKPGECMKVLDFISPLVEVTDICQYYFQCSLIFNCKVLFKKLF